MSPMASLKLLWLSFSVMIVVGTVVAVLGAILLLVSICLIIGATKVCEACTVLSTLWPIPSEEIILG